MMSLLKLVLGTRNFFKYVHVQMALPKKMFNVLLLLLLLFCDEIRLAGAAVPLFNGHK